MEKEHEGIMYGYSRGKINKSLIAGVFIFVLCRKEDGEGTWRYNVLVYSRGEINKSLIAGVFIFVLCRKFCGVIADSLQDKDDVAKYFGLWYKYDDDTFSAFILTNLQQRLKRETWNLEFSKI